MSESKLTPKEVVELHHQRYIDYETAFNKAPVNDEDTQEKLIEIVESGIDTDSEEFLDKMLDLVIERPQKRSDVNNAAFKFILFTDFYLLTQDEELSKDIMNDYNSLPIKDNIKSYFSVENEKFVKNEKQEITPEMKNFFKEVIRQQGLK